MDDNVAVAAKTKRYFSGGGAGVRDREKKRVNLSLSKRRRDQKKKGGGAAAAEFIPFTIMNEVLAGWCRHVVVVHIS